MPRRGGREGTAVIDRPTEVGRRSGSDKGSINDPLRYDTMMAKDSEASKEGTGSSIKEWFKKKVEKYKEDKEAKEEAKEDKPERNKLKKTKKSTEETSEQREKRHSDVLEANKGYLDKLSGNDKIREERRLIEKSDDDVRHAKEAKELKKQQKKDLKMQTLAMGLPSELGQGPDTGVRNLENESG